MGGERGDAHMIVVTPAWGSFALAAEALSQRYGREFSRQQVYAWWRNRDVNGFPSGKHNGEGQQLPLATVLQWYKPRTSGATAEEQENNE